MIINLLVFCLDIITFPFSDRQDLEASTAAEQPEQNHQTATVLIERGTFICGGASTFCFV